MDKEFDLLINFGGTFYKVENSPLVFVRSAGKLPGVARILL